MYGRRSNKYSREQYEVRLERGWRLVRMAREEGDERVQEGRASSGSVNV